MVTAKNPSGPSRAEIVNSAFDKLASEKDKARSAVGSYAELFKSTTEERGLHPKAVKFVQSLERMSATDREAFVIAINEMGAIRNVLAQGALLLGGDANKPAPKEKPDDNVVQLRPAADEPTPKVAEFREDPPQAQASGKLVDEASVMEMGAQACREGKTADHNEFPTGSLPASWWDAGFNKQRQTQTDLENSQNEGNRRKPRGKNKPKTAAPVVETKTEPEEEESAPAPVGDPPSVDNPVEEPPALAAAPAMDWDE